MSRKSILALAGLAAAMLAASSALARNGHHGAGVSWSGTHGGVSWDGGHDYSGMSYSGSSVPPHAYHPSDTPPGGLDRNQAPPVVRRNGDAGYPHRAYSPDPHLQVGHR